MITFTVPKLKGDRLMDWLAVVGCLSLEPAASVRWDELTLSPVFTAPDSKLGVPGAISALAELISGGDVDWMFGQMPNADGKLAAVFRPVHEWIEGLTSVSLNASYGPLRLALPFLFSPDHLSSKKVSVKDGDLVAAVQWSFTNDAVVARSGFPKTMSSLKKAVEEIVSLCQSELGVDVSELSHALKDGRTVFDLGWLSTEEPSFSFGLSEDRMKISKSGDGRSNCAPSDLFVNVLAVLGSSVMFGLPGSESMGSQTRKVPNYSFVASGEKIARSRLSRIGSYEFVWPLWPFDLRRGGVDALLSLANAVDDGVVDPALEMCSWGQAVHISDSATRGMDALSRKAGANGSRVVGFDVVRRALDGSRLVSNV